MTSFELSKLDLSGKRVRYDGRVCDKCSLSGVIHDAAFAAGYYAFPLWSDIYWDSAKYSELRDYLLHFVSKIKMS